MGSVGSYDNSSRITSSLRWESTADSWIPLTKWQTSVTLIISMQLAGTSSFKQSWVTVDLRRLNAHLTLQLWFTLPFNISFRTRCLQSCWQGSNYFVRWTLALLVSHYRDVIMGTMASQINSLIIVYSTVYSGAVQRKYQSSRSLAFVRGIHRWPVNSPHKNVFMWSRHHE